MGKINHSRVILGGVLAGVIVNLSEYLLNEVVMRAQFEEAMKALGKAMPQGGRVMTVWILWGFALGIASVWLYAAMRPRFGAGAGTAAKAGVAVWFFSSFLAWVAMWNMDLFAFSGVVVVWTLVEAIVATIAGAWLYKEEGA